MNERQSGTSHALPPWFRRLRWRLAGIFLVAAIGTIGLLAAAQRTQAFASELIAAELQYANIIGTKLDNCSLCHVSTSNFAFNPYGQAYKDSGKNFTAIEALDSDGDGLTNIAEIMAISFPGNAGDPPPAATPTPFLPATNTPTPTTVGYPGPGQTSTPTSLPTTANTPTATTVAYPGPGQTSVPTNTPTAVIPTQTPPGATPTATPTSLSPSATPPGATPTEMPTSVSPTETPPGPTPTEMPTATPGEATPTEPAPTMTSTPPATPTPPPSGVLDLDIKNFKVKSEVKLGKDKPVDIKLEVKNAGQVDGQAAATVIGMQNGAEIYNQSITVSDPVGDGASRFSFPDYVPTAAGKITWTVTINDADPDTDMDTEETKVKAEKDDHGGSGLFDLDIQNFKVTEEIKLGKNKPVEIRLDVRNAGKVDGQASATVIGIQNGVEIYNQTLSVSDAVGGGSSRYSFPGYVPTQAGKILWKITLTDADPDKDEQFRITRVGESERKDDHDD